jgi:anti-sigma B factor antagonist
MEIKSSNVGEIQVLRITGRFDSYETGRVSEWLDQACAQSPAKVVLNLAEVNFVDSSALALMVKGMKRCRQQRGDLYLCSLQQPVRVIFELTRLDKAFAIYTAETEAVSAFG